MLIWVAFFWFANNRTKREEKEGRLSWMEEQEWEDKGLKEYL